MPEPATTTPASPSFEKLKIKLRELFELDKADLDFGIYRILRSGPPMAVASASLQSET